MSKADDSDRHSAVVTGGWAVKSVAVVYAAVALGVSGAVAGCSLRGGPAQTTAVVYDGQSRSITGPTTCMAMPDGGLLILANGKDHDRVRVVLDRANRLRVVKASLHVGDWRGYSADSAEMWASRAGARYTIDGRMPPNDGELAAHQFQIVATCLGETPWRPANPGTADPGGP